MKLPEYDNRPGPNQPLYSGDEAKGEWIPWVLVVCVIGMLIGAGSFFSLIGSFLRYLFH
jgi:hypothetical protein